MTKFKQALKDSQEQRGDRIRNLSDRNKQRYLPLVQNMIKLHPDYHTRRVIDEVLDMLEAGK